MKVAARDIERTLRAPGSLRVVLLFGDDEGLIRERAATLVASVLGAAADPFALADLGPDEVGSLAAEARMGSLAGGPRVLRVRSASDALVGVVGRILETEVPTLTVLQAAGLPARGKLRSLVEASSFGAAIGCYADDDRQRGALIDRLCTTAGVTIDADARDWLVGHLGGDRAVIRHEIEKLALYVGAAGRIDLESVIACVGELADLSAADALDAAMAGDLVSVDRALTSAFAEGLEPVALMRAGLAHVQQLARCRLAMESGVPAAEAIKLARPPVFFRRVEPFRRALTRWSVTGLAATQDRLLSAERTCKSTGTPAVALCRQLLLSLARQSAPRH